MTEKFTFTPAQLAEMDQAYAEAVERLSGMLTVAVQSHRAHGSRATVASIMIVALKDQDASFLRGMAAVALAEMAGEMEES
jgi:hypothetical protein